MIRGDIVVDCVIVRIRSIIQFLKRPRMLKAGDAAPDFSVAEHSGRTATLSGLRGKHVVLWFYPKADTPG